MDGIIWEHSQDQPRLDLTENSFEAPKFDTKKTDLICNVESR